MQIPWKPAWLVTQKHTDPQLFLVLSRVGFTSAVYFMVWKIFGKLLKMTGLWEWVQSMGSALYLHQVLLLILPPPHPCVHRLFCSAFLFIPCSSSPHYTVKQKDEQNWGSWEKAVGFFGHCLLPTFSCWRIDGSLNKIKSDVFQLSQSNPFTGV